MPPETTADAAAHRRHPPGDRPEILRGSSEVVPPGVELEASVLPPHPYRSSARTATISASSSHLKRQFNFLEARVPQPCKLLAEPGEPVFRVILYPSDGTTEAIVQQWACRAHEIEVGEHPAGHQQFVDLPEQCALALVAEMVDRQAGDHHVEGCRRGERLIEVVEDEFDLRGAGEALVRPREHRLRGVDTDALDVRVAATHQRQQPAIARPDVEHPPDPLGQRFRQHPLGDVAVRYLAGEILGYALRIRPLARHRANHTGRSADPRRCRSLLQRGRGGSTSSTRRYRLDEFRVLPQSVCTFLLRVDRQVGIPTVICVPATNGQPSLVRYVFVSEGQLVV